MDCKKLYEIVYALAARDGREAVLFGADGPAAREAFTRSLSCDDFPEVWFELPLQGKPWLDFHSLVAYKDVAGKQPSYAGHDGFYNDGLSWFASQEPGKVRQLALSYDTSTGDVESPAVQLLVNGRDPSVSLGYLDAVGRDDLCPAYQTFVQSIPKEWYPCYTGVFPRRSTASDDPWVRIECLVGDTKQQAYEKDVSLLRKDLASIGLVDLNAELIFGTHMLACSPFPLELQFNVGPDGVAQPTLSATVRFFPADWTNEERKEQIAKLMERLQEMGLVDDRWTLLEEVAYAERVKFGEESVSISCIPAFLKLRWREAQPPDAKAYLVAWAHS